MQKVKYRVKVEFEIIQDYNGAEGLKGSNEFAQDLVTFVCDEAVNAGAVATYQIFNSTVDVY